VERRRKITLVDYRLEEHVAAMTWNNGENRINPRLQKADERY
jgi:hypothetical protein